MAMAEVDTLECSPEGRSDLARYAERRARKERIDYHLAGLREEIANMDEILGEWRAKGILPPEEPRRRF